MSDKALAIQGDDAPVRAMSTAAVLAQVAQVQDIMHKVMREGEHYGTIPGTDKPALLKAGAEKLSFTFRLLPKYRVTSLDLPGGHIRYEVVCELWHESGVFAGEGLGNCSTMESKYRWRPSWEDTGESIPKDSKERKDEYRKQGYGMKKANNGQWLWVRYLPDRAENPDIADTWNTVLKMAKKRAHVDAAITACAASDIFTQDVEQEETAEAERVVSPAPKAKKQRPADQVEVVAEIVALVTKSAMASEEKDEVKRSIAHADTLEKLVAIKDKLTGDTAQQAELDSAAEAGFVAPHAEGYTP